MFKRRVDIFKSVFNTTNGKEVLHHLARFSGAYSMTHVTGDPLQSAFNEGKREVYNHIIRLLETNEELMHKQYHQQVGEDQLSSFLD